MSVRTWLRRVVIIGTNNILACAAIITAGYLSYMAWAIITGARSILGMVLRLMITDSQSFPKFGATMNCHWFAPTIGVLLNMLEFPTIMLSAGLGFAQNAVSTRSFEASALRIFAMFVLPMLIVGAAGKRCGLVVLQG